MSALTVPGRHLQKFLSLDRGLQALFLRAWMQLGVARLMLALFPFKKRVGHLDRHRIEPGEAVLGEQHRAMAGQVGWAISTAGRYTPWRSTCLVQVMAAQRMLERRGVPGVFCIGATKEHKNGAEIELAAHAWLKCGDVFVTGKPGHHRYAVLTCFTWPGDDHTV